MVNLLFIQIHSIKDSLANVIRQNVDKDEKISILMPWQLINSEENINLDKKINSKVLSSGQMQKLSFIRAILLKPDILFLDESTSNLDKKSIINIGKELRSLKNTIVNLTKLLQL